MASVRPPLPNLFVTNLRLLDLNTLEDWPNIHSRSYNLKDPQGRDQKARIRCTEWSLFRLFELWNPDSARDVLLTFCYQRNADRLPRNYRRSFPLSNHYSR